MHFLILVNLFVVSALAYKPTQDGPLINKPTNATEHEVIESKVVSVLLRNSLIKTLKTRTKLVQLVIDDLSGPEGCLVTFTKPDGTIVCKD